MALLDRFVLLFVDGPSEEENFLLVLVIVAFSIQYERTAFLSEQSEQLLIDFIRLEGDMQRVVSQYVVNGC